MSKTLTIRLNTFTLIEAVKADTYITGEIDKSSDPVKNASLAYNEQAGDDTYHERKLKRTLAGAVGSLEANLAEFIDSAQGSITDTLRGVLDPGGDFVIQVKVSSRFNDGLSFPIGQLAFQYICHTMVYLWWQAIKPALAKDYLAYAQNSLTSIRLCLAKTAPATSSNSYADITGEVTDNDTAVESLVATVAFENSVYQVSDPSAIITNYSNNGYLRISHPQPNIQLNVKRGASQTAETLFTIGSNHELTPEEYNKLNGKTGSVFFVPVSYTGTAPLYIYTRTTS